MLFRGQAIRILNAIAASYDTPPTTLQPWAAQIHSPVKITHNLHYMNPLSVRLTSRYHLVPGFRMSGGMPPVPHVLMALRWTILSFLPSNRFTMFIQTILLTNMYDQSLVRPSSGMPPSDSVLPTATKSSYSAVI